MAIETPFIFRGAREPQILKASPCEAFQGPYHVKAAVDFGDVAGRYCVIPAVVWLVARDRGEQLCGANGTPHDGIVASSAGIVEPSKIYTIELPSLARAQVPSPQRDYR
jgi:hypothetical protein